MPEAQDTSRPGSTIQRPMDKPVKRPVDKPMPKGGDKTRQAKRPKKTNRNLPDAPEDRRFADPLVMEIVETWRQRQDLVRAQMKLTLQIKAICRRFTGGDKPEAERLYRSLHNGHTHPLAQDAALAIAPYRLARAPLENARKAMEKTLAKLAKDLPISHMADSIKGVNLNTLAAIVGEAGDLSAYPSVAGAWKRAGLAVIHGERQRRKSDADLAAEHGYSPSRRAVFWNVGEALFKAQGKGDTAGPYRVVYDEYREKIADRCDSDGQAHNRAKRYMLKRLLKHMTLEWKHVNRVADTDLGVIETDW